MTPLGARKTRKQHRERARREIALGDIIRDLQDQQRPVVLIAGDRTKETFAEWRAAFQYRLHVITADEDPTDFEGINAVRATTNDEMTAHIALIGPVAAVIDEQSEDVVSRLQRWQRFFFHISEGGAFITPAVSAVDPWLVATQSLASRRIGVNEVAELQASIAGVISTEGRTITLKNRDHLFKVKDEDALTVLPRRLGAEKARVLGSRAAGTIGDGLAVQSHGTRADHRIPARTMHYPELTLRDFGGVTEVRDAMLAVNGSTVLPSSFKHPWRAWNEQLRNLNDHVAVRGGEPSTPEVLSGNYYDLTAAVSGDQGHFITESLAKVWGWHEAKKRYPDLRALYRVSADDPDPEFQRTMLEAFGIASDDIHFESRDVVVNRFVSASQGWQNGGRHYVHPANATVWSKIRSGLIREADAVPLKLFVARGAEAETPGPRNGAAVERLFADSGFVIVDPATISVPDQIALFGKASVVAGFAGSGMYNMFLTDHLDKVLVLTHEANTGRNEHLIASLLADEIHYFWSKPDTEHPTGKFSSEAFNSSWDFDFDANQEALTRVLR
jgi:capsular polysaccharide biosynthesis protein